MYFNPATNQYYIRVPKTGSCSFLRSYEMAGKDWTGVQGYGCHVPLSECSKPITEEIIGFIRHPLDWAISAWNYANKYSQKSVCGAATPQFIDYVNRVNFTPLEYCTGKHSVTLHKFENLNDYFDNHNLPLVKMNVRENRVMPELTEDVMDAMHERFAADYEHYPEIRKKTDD